MRKMPRRRLTEWEGLGRGRERLAAIRTAGPILLQPAYGNYCGQFRTNGTDIEQSDLSPSQIGTVHGQCRSSCDFKNGTCRPHSETQPQCHCRCDRAIVACVNSQKTQDIEQMTVSWGIVGAISAFELRTNECSGVGLK